MLRDDFDVKDAEARGESRSRDMSEPGIDLDVEADARKLYTSLVWDKGPKVRALPRPVYLCIFHSSFKNTQLTPFLPLNKPTPDEAVLAKTTKRTRVGSSTLPPTCPCTGCRRLRAPWLVVHLAAEGRACAGGDGEQWRVRHL